MQPQRLRVLVLDSIHESGLDALRREAEVVVLPGLSGEALATAIGDYHALIVSPDTHLTADLLDRAHQLQVIGVIGARTNQIDIHTVYTHGIEIVEVHSVAATAIAEQTMRLLLGLGIPLAGQTLGIVGFGQIGSEVARRARAFDMRIVVNQPRLTLELAIADDVETLDLLDLLEQSDVVTLHVSRHLNSPPLFTDKHLAHLKPGLHLINPAHSQVVDPQALQAALDDGRLGSLTLTTHPNDPPLPADLRQHPHVNLVAPVEITTDDLEHDIAIALAQRVLEVLSGYQSGNQLNLVVAPIERVLPHEHYDPQRVAALAARLASEETLVNPPVVIHSEGAYVVLDGATRSQAFRQLGYPHVVVQVVDPDRDKIELHRWNHALTDVTPGQLMGRLRRTGGVYWELADQATAELALEQRDILSYLVTPDDQWYMAVAEAGADGMTALNEIVAAYTRLGCTIVRTLETHPAETGIPKMAGLMVFPRLSIDEVLRAGIDQKLVPAGITRFVIPGRVLRLHASLERLRAEVPLARKQAWLDKLITAKVYGRKVRYYQEPVLLLDE